ncbi:cellular communication network factor protein Ccn [Arctopsyche grandis]|uniref:cellular communication network factor protein Ccn n=1 Tax=Arctopsyche grandis TaxID=121162 RepID=UPI00406DA169
MRFHFFCVFLLTMLIGEICQAVPSRDSLQGAWRGCEDCERPLGAPCGHDMGARCRRGLTCRYHRRDDPVGVCKVPVAKGCLIDTRFYQHGEQFSLDCRTQCICQNGTYVCASRCPNENISPKGSCTHPRLIDLPGHCCRQWLCDAPMVTDPPKCIEKATPWSECSITCGTGLSFRTSNVNPSCIMRKETRLCQRKSCIPVRQANFSATHHIRRRHWCKTMQRWKGVHLRLGPCSSRKPYSPRHCGPCPQADVCCLPTKTTTITVEIKCHNFPMLILDEVSEDVNTFFVSLLEPGEDMWTPIDKHSSRHVEKYKFKPKSTKMNMNQVHLGRDFGNTYVLKVEWPLKCECGKSLCNRENNEAKWEDEDALPLLSRVHRTV